jgi:tetratricopeptide (TPR) repeat protein
MGKKKPITNTPDSHKELGNKAFLAKDYKEAAKHYTMAIEMSGESPSHIYFSNRANAYLNQGLNDKCIEDCDQAIKIEETFVKSYWRKGKA